jgi:hypothetical protein
MCGVSGEAFSAFARQLDLAGMNFFMTLMAERCQIFWYISAAIA